MAKAFLWKRRPKDDASMRRKIARCLGTTLTGTAVVKDKEGIVVHVPVSRVYRHVWKEHPERWHFVPYVLDSVRRAFQLNGHQGQEGEKRYSSLLEIGHRGKATTPTYFLAEVYDKGNGRINWTSFFDVGLPGIKAVEDKMERRQKQAGPRIWPHLPPTLGNPTPGRARSGASRSGRPPVAYDDHTTEDRRKSSGGLLILVGALLALAYMKPIAGGAGSQAPA